MLVYIATTMALLISIGGYIVLNKRNAQLQTKIVTIPLLFVFGYISSIIPLGIGYYILFPGPNIVLESPQPNEVVADTSTNIIGEIQNYTSDTNLTIDGETIKVNEDGSFQYQTELPNIRNTFELVASSEQVTDSFDLSIKRERTEQEQLEYDEGVTKKEEIKQATAEEELKEQEEWNNTEAGRLCQKNTTWTKDDCENILNDQIWIGMDIELLKAVIGEPDSSNISNYGLGNQYQYCWWNRTPNCYYDDNSDGLVDSYN